MSKCDRRQRSSESIHIDNSLLEILNYSKINFFLILFLYVFLRIVAVLSYLFYTGKESCSSVYYNPKQLYEIMHIPLPDQVGGGRLHNTAFINSLAVVARWQNLPYFVTHNPVAEISLRTYVEQSARR